MAAEEQPCQMGFLAQEWEANPDIRQLMREAGSVVKSDPGKYHPSDSVEGVANNILTLRHLVPKLYLGEDDSGRPCLGMFTIRDLEDQLLVNF